jgi:phage gp45-like
MGSINQRASVIRQTAVDPGVDGVEEVVYPHSAIINQARAISLESSDANDAFSSVPSVTGESGIRIHADNTLQVEATLSADNRKSNIEELLNSLGNQKSDLKSRSDGQKKEIDKFFSSLKELMDKEDKLNGDNDLIRANMVEMEKLREQVESMLPALYQATQDFIHTVSQLAEVNRQEKALKAEKDAIKTGDEFRKDSSGTLLTLTAENIDIATRDGDGVLRTNTGAGINIQTPSMSIGMNNEDGTVIQDSAFLVTSENVSISTDSPKEDGSEITGGGKVAIMSKEITLESMDYQKKDELYTEKGLAADGKISLAAKTIEVSAAKPANVERDENGKITKGNYTAEGDVIVR